MSRELRFVLFLATAITFLSLMSNPVWAASIFSTTANLVEISAPASVVEGALEDDDHVVVFAERQDFLLTADLSVDADNAGASIDGNGIGANAGIISAGTRIDSFMLHYDREGRPTNALGQHWLISFVNTDLIVGLIYTDGLLDASDILGAPTTTYPTGTTFRGMTGASEGVDSLTWSQFFAMSGTHDVTVEVDQLRIILKVPEPASVVSITSAVSLLLAFAALRRKR